MRGWRAKRAVPTYVWRRAKRATLYVWCDMLRETLCVPSISRRVRVRSCTAGQVTSVKNRFRYDLWAEQGLPTAPRL